VIKAATFAPPSKDAPPVVRDVSPADSDAELPRVVAAPSPEGGFFVFWIARRPEASSGLDGAAAEAVGESRAYGWLEMVRINAQGEPAGAVSRLTPAVGHISAYDVALASDEGAPGVLVVARDDGEAVDGSGGMLLRVRVRGDVIDAPVPIATEGLGRGGPSFVAGSSGDGHAAALAWVNREERSVLIPVDGTGSPSGAPSVEDALDDARLLCVIARSPGSGGPSSGSRTGAGLGSVLVAAPGDPAAPLRVYTCGGPADANR
jgi:hypothetical protein